MLVELVLEDGAYLDGSEAHRPLITALFNRHPAVARMLIEKGADVNAACKFSSSDQTNHRLSFLGPPYNGTLSFNGETPLHVAVCDRQIASTVQMLLAFGANPNAKNCEGTTPLMGLATAWFAPNAMALIEAGADPHQRDYDGYTALHHAAIDGVTEAIRWLVSLAPSTINTLTLEGRSALHFAAMNGHADAVSCLLAAGARHPFTATHDFCPLGAAAVRGNVDVVRVLIADGLHAIGGAAGVVPTAVAAALTFGWANILRMLLDCTGEENRGGWIHASRALAGPLLHYAAGYIVPMSVSALLAAGADETLADAAGQRAIDVIGTMDRNNPPLSPLYPRVPTRFRDPAKEAEIRRTLLRAPAFRALSFAWPAAVAAEPVPALGQGRPTRAPVGVRIFRPESERTWLIFS